MRERAYKAVMSLLYIPSFPIRLPQVVPRQNKSGVVFDGFGENVLSLLTVVRQNVESPPPQAPHLDLRHSVWKHTLITVQ